MNQQSFENSSTSLVTVPYSSNGLLQCLPSPPAGRTGWPWTEETPSLPPTMPNGQPWPKISIVTPSYNQGQFIEETIRSVLLQGYPNLEYIIIDGGSTDNSVEIIRKYEQYLAYWVSEKDRGQAHAINKGIAKCSGEIFNWINSDDFLTQNSLHIVVTRLGKADSIAGAVKHFGDGEEIVVQQKKLSIKGMMLCSKEAIFQQPGVWFKLDKIRKIGCLKDKYDYCFDWDLIIRYLASFSNVNYTYNILSNFRIHQQSKTVAQGSKFETETCQILQEFMQDEDYMSIHPYINLRLRWKNWHHFIKSVIEDNELSKLQKMGNILSSSCADPKLRWNRFTLGAIRQVVSS